MSDTGPKFELARAITEGELVMQYQPRVLLATLELRGVEALVRWRHPSRGIISPSEFIAAAERAGLMRDLEAWVIREVLLQAAVWRGDGIRVGVSVNVTSPLLSDEPFLLLCGRAIRIQRDPGTIMFEVSAASLAGTEPPVEGLTRLRDQGVRLALDDVTTLADLESASWARWDYVKLGRGLVTAAAREPALAATLRTLVARSLDIGARVVGVGAEDDEAIALLRDAGAYLVQGYVIAPPLGVKALWDWSEGRRRSD